MSIFVDTSALYALLVSTDEASSSVVRAFRELVSAARPLCTTSYVLIETTALLQHRIGIAAVNDLDAAIVPLLSVEWVDEPLHRKGMERLLREDRRDLSLVDCVSFEYMRELGIGAALAVDKHFVDAGFRLVPALRRKRKE